MTPERPKGEQPATTRLALAIAALAAAPILAPLSAAATDAAQVVPAAAADPSAPGSTAPGSTAPGDPAADPATGAATTPAPATNDVPAPAAPATPAASATPATTDPAPAAAAAPAAPPPPVPGDLLTLGRAFDAAAFADAVKGRIWGIDLSHHNALSDDAADHMADWGISFAILKATEGADYKDPQYDAYHAALSGRGIALGSYHFYRVDDDPEVQAKWFLQNTQPGTFLVVDVERAGQKLGPDLPAQVERFVRQIQQQTGQPVIVYSGANLFRRHLQDLAVDHFVWVADYQLAPDMPDWSLWQFYDSAHLPGIDSRVDATVFNGDQSAFAAFVASLRPEAGKD